MERQWHTDPDHRYEHVEIGGGFSLSGMVSVKPDGSTFQSERVEASEVPLRFKVASVIRHLWWRVPWRIRKIF